MEPNRLVYFHNHSDESSAHGLILLPKDNHHNRWNFNDKGFLIKEERLLKLIAPLKPEGLYRLKEHFHSSETEVVSQGALVQLGYNQKAEALIFFPKILTEINGLIFPDKGMIITDKIYDYLVPVDGRGPHVPKQKHLH